MTRPNNVVPWGLEAFFEGSGAYLGYSALAEDIIEDFQELERAEKSECRTQEQRIRRIQEQLSQIPLNGLPLMAFPDLDALVRFNVWPAEDLEEKHIVLMARRIAEWERRQIENLR